MFEVSGYSCVVVAVVLFVCFVCLFRLFDLFCGAVLVYVVNGWLVCCLINVCVVCVVVCLACVVLCGVILTVPCLFGF